MSGLGQMNVPEIDTDGWNHNMQTGATLNWIVPYHFRRCATTGVIDQVPRNQNTVLRTAVDQQVGVVLHGTAGVTADTETTCVAGLRVWDMPWKKPRLENRGQAL